MICIKILEEILYRTSNTRAFLFKTFAPFYSNGLLFVQYISIHWSHVCKGIPLYIRWHIIAVVTGCSPITFYTKLYDFIRSKNLAKSRHAKVSRKHIFKASYVIKKVPYVIKTLRNQYTGLTSFALFDERSVEFAYKICNVLQPVLSDELSFVSFKVIGFLFLSICHDSANFVFSFVFFLHGLQC